jgi:hypothetical protein
MCHVLSNLDLKLLKVSCAHSSLGAGGDNNGGGRGGQVHKENIESKHFKIYLSNFSC